MILFIYPKDSMVALRRLKRKQDLVGGLIKPNNEGGLNYSLVSSDGEEKLLIDWLRGVRKR